MKRWKRRWRNIRKGRLAAVTTGVLVAGTLLAVLANASGFHAIFEPEDYQHFEDQYDATEEYNSAAGDGEQSDLADESEDGEDSADENVQKALQVAEDESGNQRDQDGLGMADDGNRTGDSGQENPDAFELVDHKGPGGLGVRPGDGSGGNAGGNSGNGTKPGGNDGSGGSGQPGGTDDPGVPGGQDPSDQTPGWEAEQLKPRDPVQTEHGVLVKLAASIDRDYCRGDSFKESDATVVATFRKNKKDKKVTLPYGGENGYSVRLSTKNVGTHTAVFTYLGMTARARYDVISSGLAIRYYSEKDGEIYAVNFPGPLGGDEETMDKIAGLDFHAVSGNIVDLTDLHSRVIAYLGDEKIKEKFLAETTHRNVVFLEEEDGYLSTMLRGFQYYANGALEEGGPYTYYPVYNWGENIMRSVMDVAGPVPEGFRIRRATKNQGDLETYRGSQVLEQYTGDASVISVPAGVTELALKGPQGNGTVTSLVLPESVAMVDFESVAECLPKLESYEVTGRSCYQAADGVLYSGDGRTLLSVPAGKTSLRIPDTVTAIAGGAFRNSSLKELEIPESVRTLEAGCFERFSANVIRIRGSAPLKVKGDTGYQGKVLFQDSAYDVVMKSGMFAFCSRDIVFGAMDQNGAELLEKTGLYQYDGSREILTLRAEAQTLAGIPAGTRGIYMVPGGITAIEAGAFAGAEGLWEIVIPDTVKELRGESLVLPQSVGDIYLSGGGVEVSPAVFGNPGAGGKVPGITVHVPKESYSAYLKSWSLKLDGTYGEKTAKRLLKITDGQIFYENGAKYQKIEGQEQYLLLKVYAQSSTAFGVKEGTVQIQAGAFSLCSSLEILHLPGSVKRVEDGAFQGCRKLKTAAAEKAGLLSKAMFDKAAGVKIYEKGKQFSGFVYDEGILYGRSPSGVFTLIDVPTDYSGELVVYENTGSLGAEALKDCGFVEKIEIPDQKSLTEIGDRCFENCTAVTEIRLDSGANLKKVGDEVFRSCGSLEGLYLPESLSSAGKALCRDCSSLQTVQAAGLKKIPEEMFFGCQSLRLAEESLGWGKISEIGDRAFAYCIMISQVPAMPELKSLGVQAFYTCQRLNSIVLSEKLASMGEECFGECSLLSQVELNGKLTGISRYCFYGCHSLVKLSFGGRQKKALKVIGVQAFGECTSLETVDLSGFTALTQMGERTFEGCDFLTTVRLPGTLGKIPDYCFDRCHNLSILTLNSKTVTGLGKAVFGDSLSPFIHVWVKAEQLADYEKAYKKTLDQTYGKGTTKKILGKIDPTKEIIRGITFTFTDKGRVLKEASKEFKGDYTVPIDTVRIEQEAFMNCPGLTGIVLPADSSISLGARCFKGCAALETVELDGDIPEWGAEVFMNCTSLKRATIGGGNQEKIPRIGTRAFKGCTGLTGRDAVSLRTDIRILGEECFAECVNIGAFPMTASAREGIEVIEEKAFYGCKNLSQFTTSTFTGMKKIGAYAFSECDALANPSIPAGVASIGEGCFAGCDKLATVSFYGVLEEYPKDCFKNCPKLTRTGGVAAALSGLKRIGESAYEGCASLTTNSSWNLGKYTGLEEIGANAFKGCAGMTDIHVAAALKKIGTGAFQGLSSVEQITFDSEEVPEMGAVGLDTMPGLARIFVPDSQADGDSVYRAYLAVFSRMIGEEKAYEILDSISDGARERNRGSRADMTRPENSGSEKDGLEKGGSEKTGLEKADPEKGGSEKSGRKPEMEKESAGEAGSERSAAGSSGTEEEDAGADEEETEQ